MKYEAPAVQVVGSVGDLTQTRYKTLFKKYDGIDFTFTLGSITIDLPLSS
jgi:hypothetical protein